MWRKLLGIISVDFDATSKLLIIHTAFVKYEGHTEIHEQQFFIK